MVITTHTLADLSQKIVATAVYLRLHSHDEERKRKFTVFLSDIVRMTSNDDVSIEELLARLDTLGEGDTYYSSYKVATDCTRVALKKRMDKFDKTLSKLVKEMTIKHGITLDAYTTKACRITEKFIKSITVIDSDTVTRLLTLRVQDDIEVSNDMIHLIELLRFDVIFGCIWHMVCMQDKNGSGMVHDDVIEAFSDIDHELRMFAEGIALSQRVEPTKVEPVKVVKDDSGVFLRGRHILLGMGALAMVGIVATALRNTQNTPVDKPIQTTTLALAGEAGLEALETDGTSLNTTLALAGEAGLEALETNGTGLVESVIPDTYAAINSTQTTPLQLNPRERIQYVFRQHFPSGVDVPAALEQYVKNAANEKEETNATDVFYSTLALWKLVRKQGYTDPDEYLIESMREVINIFGDNVNLQTRENRRIIEDVWVTYPSLRLRV
jgi:hypothetical protein